MYLKRILPAITPQASSTPAAWYGTAYAAYRAKGAASYAASLLNLVNPLTYTLAPDMSGPHVNCPPDWSAGIGWTFTAANYDNLVIPAHTINQNTSMVVKYANSATFGGHQASWFGLLPPNGFCWGAGGWKPTTFSASGIKAIIGNSCYEGATLKSQYTDSNWSDSVLVGLCCRVGVASQPDWWADGVIEAVALYNHRLTESEYSALLTAMAAI